MRKYLLPEAGNFYKANLHCHTIISDGARTPEQIKDIYRRLGYSVVAYTDHDVLVPHNDLCDDTFIALNGFEVEITENRPVPWPHLKTCHICFIALEPDNIIQPMWHRNAYLFGNAPKYKDIIQFDENEPDYIREFTGEKLSEMMNIGRNKGFFVTYNHPSWSLEDYRDYMSYDGMHAFEIFNGGCLVVGNEDYNPRVYNDMLRGGKRIYCVGSDDNHNAGTEGTRNWDSGIAWTVIKAPCLDYRSITKALEGGNFYASEGPEIYELYTENNKVYIKCSNADRIFCTYSSRKAGIVFSENNIPVTEASFDIDPDDGFFRITVVDNKGRHACTNAYFLD